MREDEVVRGKVKSADNMFSSSRQGHIINLSYACPVHCLSPLQSEIEDCHGDLGNGSKI